MTTERVAPGASRVMGIFKDYLLALDSIRSDLIFQEEKLSKILIEFYKIEDASMNENCAKEYMITVSKSFDLCNSQINHITLKKPIVIDGQVPIANMINTVREFAINIDAETLNIITDFWENIKYNLEMFQILIDQFDSDVLARIKLMYAGSCIPLQIGSSTTANNSVVEFLQDIERYAKQIPEKITKCRLLIRSCGNHMRIPLLDRSSISDRLLIGINIPQYPLLKVIPDLGFKLGQIFQICRKWLDREETFIHEMNQQIRHNRIMAKETESRLISARNHQSDILKLVKKYYLLCQNRKRNLKEISNEIKSLEIQIRETTFAHENLSEEKMKTMSMSDFLNLSISQTRRNYALQMKKQKLLNQVRQLETSLIEIDYQIHSMRQEISLKFEEKNKAHQKLLSDEKAYNEAKADLESYSISLYNYKMELSALRQSLITMESLKVLKTSPEFIENISGVLKNEEPSVQLAPSLKVTIDRKIGQMSHKI